MISSIRFPLGLLVRLTSRWEPLLISDILDFQSQRVGIASHEQAQGSVGIPMRQFGESFRLSVQPEVHMKSLNARTETNFDVLARAGQKFVALLYGQQEAADLIGRVDLARLPLAQRGTNLGGWGWVGFGWRDNDWFHILGT